MNQAKTTVLLVTDREEVIEKTQCIFDECEKNVDLRVINSVEQSIPEIIKNGFDITIFDAAIKIPRGFKIEDVIHTNYKVNKNMVIICKKTDQKRLAKVIKNQSVLDHIKMVGENCSADQFVNTVSSTLNLPKRDSKKMLKELMSEIDKNNQSIFQRYNFLSFI